MSNIFSTSAQLSRIVNILSGYLRLPFSSNSIPGTLLENVVSNVRHAQLLNTYDFVDVINREQRIGWQVKSTKSTTPVTWKRAKIPNSVELIEYSRQSAAGLQNLGDTIIAFCNDHALESLKKYNLAEIGYCRLIVQPSGKLTYFEKVLCTNVNPKVFYEDDFYWSWSVPKKTRKKEQLPALHGTHKHTGSKWFAWHGLGENQLHFSGEKAWWPRDRDANRIDFRFPQKRLSQEQFMDLLDQVSRLI